MCYELYMSYLSNQYLDSNEEATEMDDRKRRRRRRRIYEDI
jgi:hypothetical protein